MITKYEGLHNRAMSTKTELMLNDTRVVFREFCSIHRHVTAIACFSYEGHYCSLIFVTKNFCRYYNCTRTKESRGLGMLAKDFHAVLWVGLRAQYFVPLLTPKGLRAGQSKLRAYDC